jgi:hypothetical protein
LDCPKEPWLSSLELYFSSIQFSASVGNNFFLLTFLFQFNNLTAWSTPKNFGFICRIWYLYFVLNVKNYNLKFRSCLMFLNNIFWIWNIMDRLLYFLSDVTRTYVDIFINVRYLL